MSITINKIVGRKILNSRDDWTIECAVELSDGSSHIASVPEGKSKGAYEALCLPPDQAILAIDKISHTFRWKTFSSLGEIDQLMIDMAGSRKGDLGANSTLAISTACARAFAHSENHPLWSYLRNISNTSLSHDKQLRLMVNVINGGLHAGNGLAFQEYMIIPRAKDLPEAVLMATNFYHALGAYLLKNFGPQATLLGDEGGYAPMLDDDLIPLKILSDVVAENGWAGKFDFGIDVAASNVKKQKEVLLGQYRQIANDYPLIYLEDPFDENDFASFGELNKEFSGKTIVVGDDLTVTNPERIKMANESHSVRGIIIKPNQIGTVSETLSAIALAREYGWSIFVSHRSGETNDDFIADLAFGIGADGIKLGSPARGERVAKYNRLLAISRERGQEPFLSGISKKGS